MRKYVSKVLTLLCVCAILISHTALGANAKLVEKYKYDENFKYNDEIIGHALKSTVAKIVVEYKAELRYKPTIFNKEMFENWKEEVIDSAPDSASDDEVKSIILNYLRQNLALFLSFGDEKSVSAGGVWVGSGVTISENGYIATNAHVATLSDEDKAQMYAGGIAGENGVAKDFESLLQSLKNVGIELSESEEQELYAMLLKSAAEEMTVQSEDLNLFVCFPTAEGKTDFDSALKYEAEVVEEGTAVNRGVKGQTEDVAILKIDAENLVCLKLSESYPEVNSKIVSAGFPAASDEGFVSAGSMESVLSVTVGTGQVARLVPIEGTELQAIEITTTISGGNSGGPSVDENLQIEGLNTYTLNSDNRYAYMVPSEYVSELAEGHELIRGEVTLTFLTGLQLLQQGKGKSALECFGFVANAQGNTPYIEYLIDKAKKTGESSGNTQDESGLTTTETMIYAGAGVLIVLIIAVTVVMLKPKKHKKEFAERETITVSEYGSEIPHVRPGAIPPPVVPPYSHPAGSSAFDESRRPVAEAHRPAVVPGTDVNKTLYMGVPERTMGTPVATPMSNPMSQGASSGMSPAPFNPSPGPAHSPKVGTGLKSTMRTKKADSAIAASEKKEERAASEHSAFKMASSDLDD